LIIITKNSTSSAALAASERSGEAANAAGAVAPGPRPPVPDSEVIARPRRRSFTAEYRRSILDQADAAHDAGAVGLLLRREGLYSSHLATWRRQRKQGGIDALTPKKRGPKVVVSPLVKENREQQATIIRLTKKLKNAELIIEVQKKVAALLGNPIPNIQIDGEN
jgi:transposase-like protein